MSEVLYVLCKKLQDGFLSDAEYSRAVNDLNDQMKVITTAPVSDASLIIRADELRLGYGCSHSADGLYLALAEALAPMGGAEVVTFDRGMKNQAAKNAPTVSVNLLRP